MTDTTIVEAPTDLEQPVPPAPEAVEGFCPNPGKTTPEVVSEGEAPVMPEANGRALPEVEFPVGSTRQAVLDHMLDSVEAGPQSVAQILAAMPPGTSRNTAETAIRREYEAGRIMRTSPGHYALAPARSPELPKPAPPPTPTEEATWLAVLDGWINDPETWDRERFGPRPDEPGRRIPAGVVAKGVDRNRKRQERRKAAEAAAARQAAADAALCAKLKDATGGNFTPGPGIQDISAIKAALELVPLDDVLFAIRHKTDRKCYPKNEPATSWGEERLLKAIAEYYVRFRIVPSLVSAWAAAKAPGKAVERAEAAPATQPAPAPENAQAAPPANGSVPSEPDPMPAALAAKTPGDFSYPNSGSSKTGDQIGEPTRESILGAFMRNRPPPQPAAPPPAPEPRSPQQVPQPRPAAPQPPSAARPWFAPAAQPQEREPISEAAWDEICGGFFVGNLDWSRRKWGPAPGESGCRVPLAILRRNRLA
jgi:hypothetical protein